MEEVFEQFRTYDFSKSSSYEPTLEQVYNQYLIVMSDKDLEIKQDLSNGIINPDRIPQADREQLQLQTKIFVFCSETDNILEIQDYQFWLTHREQNQLLKSPELKEISSNKPTIQSTTESQLINNGDSIMVDTTTSENDEVGEYTSNYQEIVDMIVNNKPIPGIKQIPKTILDPETASSSVLQQRKKPWEIIDDETVKTDEKVLNNTDSAA